MPVMQLTFRIHRCAPGGADAHHDVFRLDVDERASVLDVLDRIRVEMDPSLIYRHSCHHSSCGTCAMRINGRDRLACITSAHEVAAAGAQPGIVTVEPLRGLPLLGDLMVDMCAFYRHFGEDWGTLRHSEGRAQAALPAGVARFTRMENCIECGCCVSACPVTGEPSGSKGVEAASPQDDTAGVGPSGAGRAAAPPGRGHDGDNAASDDLGMENGFAGPAVLAALNRELARRPGEADSLLAFASGPHGERHCQRHLACSRACPNGVYPAKDIMDLRRMKTRREG